jgi:membrane protein required for colicin V production
MNLIAGFNWLDFLILLLIIASTIIGFTQGLLRQVIGLAALYVAAVLGAQYYVVLSDWIGKISMQGSTNRFLNAFSFLVILFVVSSVINWLAFDAYRSTKLRIAPLIDQVGGTVLGLVTVSITIAVILPVLTFATSEPWPWSESARLFVLKGMQTSQILPIFNLLIPLLLNGIRPWLPAGLPSLFGI